LANPEVITLVQHPEFRLIGGGAIRRIPEWAGQADGTLVPKVHAGLAQGPARLSGFLLYLDGTEALVFGINFGFRL